jgi:hypothetical protein
MKIYMGNIDNIENWGYINKINIDSFNYNYKFKLEGFFYKYIYKYNIYLKNINIGFSSIWKSNIDFTIFLNTKKLIYCLGLLNTNLFQDYNNLILYINNSINNLIKINKIELKDIKEIELSIWEYKQIINLSLKQKKLMNEKKLIKNYNKIINQIIELKFDEKYDLFKLQNLLKELKKFLIVKIINYFNHENCIKHLFNLIKAWKTNDIKLLYYWINKTIEKYNN